MKASTMQELVDKAYDKSAEAMYGAILGTSIEALTAVRRARLWQPAQGSYGETSSTRWPASSA
jgi:hypothetical protein